MPEIFIVLFIILSIFGLVNIVRKIIMWLLKYDDGEIITVIPIKGHCENVEYRIRCAYERANWSSENHRIICLDKGMDDETRRLCSKICDRFGIELIIFPTLVQAVENT